MAVVGSSGGTSGVEEGDVGAEGEPTCQGGGGRGGGVGAVGEPTPHTTLMSWVGAESEPTREAGDSGGDATSPSSCCRQSLLGGDISFLFLLALVTRGVQICFMHVMLFLQMFL